MGLTGSAILQLHPTRRCNLRCLHCYSQSGPHVAASTSIDVLRSAVTDAADLGYTVVSISGGEPLLYPDLTALLRHAKHLGLNTTVTSNGMLLSERRLGELAGLVDVLALSLDGEPETHERMRGDERAFRTLDRRLPGVRASGIPFGFITTLTMHNVAEVEWVVGYAREHGAGLVQIHPLELEGAAVQNLAGSLPDLRESAFAVIEGARLEAVYGITVQVDIARRSELVGHPQEFLVETPSPDLRLSEWLTPLVIETDGTVVPLTYGFPQRYALGSVVEKPLRVLADAWDPAPFLDVTRRVGERLMEDPRPLFNWYEELSNEARRLTAPVTAGL
jgi:MoaA/NifB/PqqE/SkfB family radical SAM enzyme